MDPRAELTVRTFSERRRENGGSQEQRQVTSTHLQGGEALRRTRRR